MAIKVLEDSNGNPVLNGRGQQIWFVNMIKVRGVEWAQIHGRFENNWWRTDLGSSADAYYANDDAGHIDMEHFTPAEMRLLEYKLEVAKAIRRKTNKLAKDAVVQGRGEHVREKARRTEERGGKSKWFG